MGMSTSATNADEYIELQKGWVKECASYLRDNVLKAAELDEMIKWGHIVYYSNGPVLLIRAEKERILFGFWRGKRLIDIEPNLKPGGKYEMATMKITAEPYPSSSTIQQLVKKAVALNEELGNPQDAAKK